MKCFYNYFLYIAGFVKFSDDKLAVQIVLSTADRHRTVRISSEFEVNYKYMTLYNMKECHVCKRQSFVMVFTLKA